MSNIHITNIHTFNTRICPCVYLYKIWRCFKYFIPNYDSKLKTIQSNGCIPIIILISIFLFQSVVTHKSFEQVSSLYTYHITLDTTPFKWSVGISQYLYSSQLSATHHYIHKSNVSDYENIVYSNTKFRHKVYICWHNCHNLQYIFFCMWNANID